MLVATNTADAQIYARKYAVGMLEVADCFESVRLPEYAMIRYNSEIVFNLAMKVPLKKSLPSLKAAHQEVHKEATELRLAIETAYLATVGRTDDLTYQIRKCLHRALRAFPAPINIVR